MWWMGKAEVTEVNLARFVERTAYDPCALNPLHSSAGCSVYLYFELETWESQTDAVVKVWETSTAARFFLSFFLCPAPPRPSVLLALLLLLACTILLNASRRLDKRCLDFDLHKPFTQTNRAIPYLISYLHRWSLIKLIRLLTILIKETRECREITFQEFLNGLI